MSKPINHRNRPTCSYRVNKDGVRGWRLITPQREYQYDTQEEALQAMKDMQDGIDMINDFLYRVQPPDIERVSMYRA